MANRIFANPMLLRLLEMASEPVKIVETGKEMRPFSLDGVLAKTLLLVMLGTVIAFYFAQRIIPQLSIATQLFWMIGSFFLVFACMVLSLFFVRLAFVLAPLMASVLGLYGALWFCFMNNVSPQLGFKTMIVTMAVFTVVLVFYRLGAFVFHGFRRNLLIGLSIVLVFYVLQVHIQHILISEPVGWFVQWVYPFLVLLSVTTAFMLDVFLLASTERRCLSRNAEWYAAGALCFSLVWAFFMFMAVLGNKKI